MSRITRLAVAVIAIVVVAACAGDEPTAEPDPAEPDADVADPPDETDPPEETDQPDGDDDSGLDRDDLLEPDPPGDRGEGAGSTALLDDEVQQAIADAADRTGADRDDVEVVATELVTWPDGAIGCPEPGQMYTMALVEGYRIVLEVDGNELAYHGAQGSPPSYCADPSDPTGDGRALS